MPRPRGPLKRKHSVNITKDLSDFASEAKDALQVDFQDVVDLAIARMRKTAETDSTWSFSEDQINDVAVEALVSDLILYYFAVTFRERNDYLDRMMKAVGEMSQLLYADQDKVLREGLSRSQIEKLHSLLVIVATLGLQTLQNEGSLGEMVKGYEERKAKYRFYDQVKEFREKAFADFQKARRDEASRPD